MSQLLDFDEHRPSAEDADRDRLLAQMSDLRLTVEHMLVRSYRRERDDARLFHRVTRARAELAERQVDDVRNAIAKWENGDIGKRELIDTIERIVASAS